jgi:hypothetical protein
MPSLSREGERHRDRAGDLTPVLFGADTVAGLCRRLTGFSIHPWSLRPRHPSASLRLSGRCYQTGAQRSKADACRRIASAA